MHDYPIEYPRPVDATRPHAGESDFLWKTYRWMSIGLALTGLVALVVASTPSLVEAMLANRVVLYGTIIAELMLVVGFAARASSMSFGAVLAVFSAYAALNGVTMATISIPRRRSARSSSSAQAPSRDCPCMVPRPSAT